MSTAILDKAEKRMHAINEARNVDQRDNKGALEFEQRQRALDDADALREEVLR